MDPSGFNPMMFTHGQMMNNFMGLDEGNVELFVDHSKGARPTTLPSNLGDYFIALGLDHLIQQLADNDSNRYGTPSTSKSSVAWVLRGVTIFLAEPFHFLIALMRWVLSFSLCGMVRLDSKLSGVDLLIDKHMM